MQRDAATSRRMNRDELKRLLDQLIASGNEREFLRIVLDDYNEELRDERACEDAVRYERELAIARNRECDAIIAQYEKIHNRGEEASHTQQ